MEYVTHTSNLTCYTAVFDPASKDLQAARWVAKEYGVELVEVPVPEPNEERVRAAVRAVEIPMKAQVEIALAHLPLMEAVAKDGHAVCLSGEAADELFGGYGGMQIKAASADDEGYRAIKRYAVRKMSRGNFPRVNKVGMAHGIEARLPFMQTDLVDLALAATKEQSPPGKKLLKAAALEIGVPAQIVNRTKETFQGGAGINDAALAAGYGVTNYNQIARDLLGFAPKE
jgi:asparagine synthase (glutamine-hydrolysing)